MTSTARKTPARLRVGMALVPGLLALLTGCSAEAPFAEPATTTQPVVYGEDDRTDVHAHPDPAWRALARQSIVALVRAGDVVTSDPNDIRFRGRTLGSARSLCPGERFADQPSIAFCSGTLIGPDLVLTAGHCIEDAADCSDTRFVFNFVMENDTSRATITAEDVHSCGALLVSYDDGRADYAVVRLDRPVSAARSPASVRPGDEALDLGAGVGVIGFPSGIPAKIDLGGTVTRNRPTQRDYFQASLDTFGGNSGSGVFTLDGLLAGILVRGEQDYVRDGRCFRVNVLPEPGPGQRAESVTYVARAIEALCEREPALAVCQPPDRVYCAPCSTDDACGGSGDAQDEGGLCDASGGLEGVCLPPCARDGDCRMDHTCRNGHCAPMTHRRCSDRGEVLERDTCGRERGTVAVCDDGTRCTDGVCLPEEQDAACNSATALPAQTGRVSGRLSSGAASAHTGSCAGEGPETVYRFSIEEPTAFAAVAEGFDTVLYLRSVCDEPSSELLCNDDSSPPGGLGSRIEGDLDPGTYWLFLDAYGSDVGSYSLDLTFERLCSSCTPGAAACDGSGETVRCVGDADCPREVRETCAEGLACTDGTCRPGACIDPCTPGDRACLNERTPLVCVDSADGCGRWERGDTCPAGATCTAGTCVPPEGEHTGPGGGPWPPPSAPDGAGTAPDAAGEVRDVADELLDLVEDVEQNMPAVPGCSAAGGSGAPPGPWLFAVLLVSWGRLRQRATRTPHVPCSEKS